jgi:hypothetical protein
LASSRTLPGRRHRIVDSPPQGRLDDLLSCAAPHVVCFRPNSRHWRFRAVRQTLTLNGQADSLPLLPNKPTAFSRVKRSADLEWDLVRAATVAVAQPAGPLRPVVDENGLPMRLMLTAAKPAICGPRCNCSPISDATMSSPTEATMPTPCFTLFAPPGPSLISHRQASTWLQLTRRMDEAVRKCVGPARAAR